MYQGTPVRWGSQLEMPAKIEANQETQVKEKTYEKLNSKEGCPNDDDHAIIEKKQLEEKQRLLLEWRSRMHALACMHVSSYEYFNKLAIAIMVPSILLSIGCGTTSLTADNHCSNTTDRPNVDVWTSHNVKSIVLGIMSLLSASLSGIYHFLRLSERQKDHLTVAAQFDKLARQIRVQSILTETNERMFVNLSEFIKDASDSFDYLTDNMPYIPAFISKKYPWMSNIELPRSTNITSKHMPLDGIVSPLRTSNNLSDNITSSPGVLPSPWCRKSLSLNSRGLLF